jgi:hypothetical protein
MEGMEGLSGHVSIVVSFLSAMVTFYFWLVKAKKERPDLKIYKADAQLGGYAHSSCEDPVKLIFEVRSVVANYSTLPNALLGARGWVKLRDGSWREGEARLDPKTPLPLNIAPLQTVRLDLAVAITVPAIPEGNSCRNTNETFALYRDRCISQPVEVKVAVNTLGEKLFASVLTSAKRAA